MSTALPQRLGLELQRDDALPLWTRPGAHDDLRFAEGDAIHQRLVTVLEGAQDLSVASPELAAAGRRLSLAHHLSAERSNLLRGFEWRRGAHAIEVGAGCGAVSRYLGEVFERVVALEGDPSRALAAATRLRDLPHADVVAAPLDALDVSQSFDIAVAVGVLEYAALYGDEPEPFHAFLERMRGLLHDDGLLVLAIENKLGMQYFAGAREDHSGIRYDSVEGYHRSGGRTARTFGRQELLTLMHEAGFQTVVTHLPFPDYKFPRSLLAAELAGQPASPKLAELTAGGRPQVSGGGLTFDSALAWRELMVNGLVADMANSLLVFASPGAGLSRQVSWDWDAISLSTARRPRFWTSTEVRGLRNGTARVHKRRIGTGEPATAALLQYEYTEPWHEQPSLEFCAAAQMQHHHCSTRDVARVLEPWLRFLTEQAENGLMPGTLLDATPENGVLVDGSYHLLDREFEWRTPVELRATVARGLYYLSLRAALRPGALRRYPGAPVLLLMRRIATDLGIERFGWRDVVALLRHEARVQEAVSGHARWLTVRGLLRGMLAVRVPLSPGAGRRPVVRGRLSRLVRQARATVGR